MILRVPRNNDKGPSGVTMKDIKEKISKEQGLIAKDHAR